ncbi:hypothetical protein QJS10_CPA09g00652 [Acorus calamus]|uniref:Uncharacterized protein n=1 Tax=Acorus calamus TaxID=4465 RepID=A0AAV9E418_ACOCL|nr:hypothetical protein QJS10_CPA09g00652 [Acorus calamus]
MEIRDCHKRLLKKTSFNILMSIPKMQFQAELVDVIVSNYNLDEDYFEIGQLRPEPVSRPQA